ncbi:conserved hypothetical protein [Candidatus Methylobacter favarea]|uniref:Peptidase M41 domain-containing protein n=1 Tax=Candidatus Methylobacter favarea TaxID=2707345 RepID=A0A8S0XFV7_9GAMM|nr:hypothetical protein [Candidatus Methylobacter favarea]CAA9890647.1 conserved hypothetical protein [Candidatus Methylobacter favarea]
MNRSHLSPLANIFNPLTRQELNLRTAIHEAGHAAAIYLGNKHKQLPPVFFRIYINEPASRLQVPANSGKRQGNCMAEVEGGRLIHTLPSSIDMATRDFSSAQKQAYECAFDADIVNMLAGPLAEAKYIAQRDDELINPGLVNPDSLHFYGGSSDLEATNEYLACFTADRELRQKKMAELFLAAFNFVNNSWNWLAINALADYILMQSKNIIECEEAIAVINARFAAYWSPVKI